MISRDFIRLWEPRYDTRKYPPDFYLRHRESARHAISPERFKNDLLALLHWKDGNALAFVPGEAHAKPRILRPVAALNDFALAHFARSFQGLVSAGESDFEQRTLELRNKLSNMWGTVVVPAFLLHIARPDLLPIIDQHTVRAFLELERRQVVEEPKIDWNVWRDYVSFFDDCVMAAGFDSDLEERGYVDRALFAYGKSLKKSKRGSSSPKYDIVARPDKTQSQMLAAKLRYAKQHEKQKLFKTRALNTPATKEGFANLWEQINAEALGAAKEELASERAAQGRSNLGTKPGSDDGAGD